jgi:hypothetical protein
MPGKVEIYLPPSWDDAIKILTLPRLTYKFNVAPFKMSGRGKRGETLNNSAMVTPISSTLRIEMQSQVYMTPKTTFFPVESHMKGHQITNTDTEQQTHSDSQVQMIF